MPKKKFVLGGGISGLIWTFLNKDYELLAAPDKDNFSRNYMIWLHDCAEMRILLDELGFKDLDMLMDKSYIGYFYDGAIHEELTPEIKKAIIDRKMTPYDVEIQPHFGEKTDGSKLSQTTVNGGNYMNTLKLDLGTLTYALRRAIGKRRVETFVTSINDKTIGLNSQNDPDAPIYAKYDRLVSTLPAPVFQKLYTPRSDTIFQGHPTTMVVVRKKPDMFDDRYEMVYYDGNFPFTRISKQHNKYCIEFTGAMDVETFAEFFPAQIAGLFDFWVIPGGRIYSKNITPPNDKIIFSGRFSQWDHTITTEYVIKQALEERLRAT